MDLVKEDKQSVSVKDEDAGDMVRQKKVIRLC